MRKKNQFRLFVVGGSSGGLDAVRILIRKIPKDINAAFLLVLHRSIDSSGSYAEILKDCTDLNVIEAKDNMDIQKGCLYLAVNNKHLFVTKNTMHLSSGPRENLFRPAIDVLFRSAAIAYQNCCVGILLTGRLNDGTAGLEAISKCGGLAVIQNPATAKFADMPRSAYELVDIDYVVNIEEMSDVILKIMEEKLPPKKNVPKNLARENEIATTIKSQIELEQSIGHQVPISCSSCGGPLWEIENSKVKRYRCHVGHAFTEEALLKDQSDSIEEALWISLRTLEEKRMLLNRMLNDYKRRNSKSLIKSYSSKIDEVTAQVDKLRNVLQIND